MTKRKIVWPIYDVNFKRLKKDGSIDDVSLREIFKQCKKEAIAYTRKMVKEHPEIFNEDEETA